jgi:hypothetical protein
VSVSRLAYAGNFLGASFGITQHDRGRSCTARALHGETCLALLSVSVKYSLSPRASRRMPGIAVAYLQIIDRSNHCAMELPDTAVKVCATEEREVGLSASSTDAMVITRIPYEKEIRWETQRHRHGIPWRCL